MNVLVSGCSVIVSNRCDLGHPARRPQLTPINVCCAHHRRSAPVLELFETVADRIWQPWWNRRGHSLDTIRPRLSEAMNARPILLVLVVHDRGAFLGTASVIACDLDERPRLSLFVAAVSVAPSARGMALARRWWLTRRKRALRFALSAYLCARPERTGFYQRLGWTLVKAGFGTAASLRIHPRGKDGARRDQAVAAMKIERAKPVR
jgi:hypothetical protein